MKKNKLLGRPFHMSYRAARERQQIVGEIDGRSVSVGYSYLGRAEKKAYSGNTWYAGLAKRLRKRDCHDLSVALSM